MKNHIYQTQEELLNKAEEAKHKEFKYIDSTNRLGSLKGGIGQMMEEGHFEYSVNSESRPDFDNLGIELKVSPMVKDKNGKYKAKERMVLNIIDYMHENLDSFFDSHFWYKNEKILMMFYEHRNDIPRELWYIDDFILYNWPDEDLSIVINDWTIIADKIREGKAHEISEADTMYLAACTKGSTAAESYRQQPYSDIPAKQRAYSLKPSYVTYILNHYVYGTDTDEHIIKSTSLLKTASFEDVIKDMFTPYIGKTQEELMTLFQIKKSKQTNASIINKILKLNGDVSHTAEFQKANIQAKTIRIEKNGNIKESMSFPTFDFKEIVKQTWETSDLYNTLSTTRFMFVIFQKVDDSDETSYLQSVKFWGMTDDDLEEVRMCWEKTVETIKYNLVINPTSNGFENNLPGQKDNRITHVRPHASKAYYKFGNYEKGDPKNGCELPDGRWITKQCFWLNRSYIKEIIK